VQAGQVAIQDHHVVRGEVELGCGGQPVVGEVDGHPLIA
jgi:hypothetical protein